MRRGETVATARRIGPIPAFIGDTAVTGENFNGAGERLLGVAGDAYVDLVGDGDYTIGEIGGGYYYLEVPEDDAESLALWIAVRLDIVCDLTIFREDLEHKPTGIVVGEADATRRRVGPLDAYDSDGAAILEADIGDVDIEVTINGSVWAAGAGALEFTEDGELYYVADPAEITGHGWIAVKLGGIAEEFTFREDLVEFAAENNPTVTVVSPTPFVAAGTAGAFSSDPAVAAITPIVLEISDLETDLQYVCVTASFGTSEAEEVVYRRGAFRGSYLASTELVTGDDVTLTISRAGGWPMNNDGTVSTIRFAVDAIDADGNLTAGDGAMNIKVNGTLLTSTDTIDFLGDGLIVTEEDGIVSIESASPEVDVEDDGDAVASTSTLNFVGFDVSEAGGVVTVEGSGGGLFGPILSAVPTAASTGFSSWWYQLVGSTYADGELGPLVIVPANGGNNRFTARAKAAPATPYTITMLMAFTSPLSAAPAATYYCGWGEAATGTANKGDFVLMFPAQSVQTYRYLLTNATTVSSNPQLNTALMQYPTLMWWRLRDDGTTATISWSASGDDASFLPVYTVTKAGSHLGASGYNYVLFGATGPTPAMVQMLSYEQT